MKNLIFIAALAVGLSGYSQNGKALAKKEKMKTEAQANRQKLSPEERDQKQLERLASKLGLSDLQQKQVGKILAEQTQMREKGKMDRKAEYGKGNKMSADEKEAWRKGLLAKHNEMKMKIVAVLTPEQKLKWEEMQEHNQKRAAEREENRHEMKDRR